MAAEQGPMSGFRDMLAEQMIPRQEMLSTITRVYEGYGFTPLKTPALERLSTLTGKYGEEGSKLIYSFEDNGGRDVAMRYDQTVPLARVVAQHSHKLPMPYKRYAVGEVWRGESPQAGRYREFTQFDADTVGTSSPIADAEIVAMMSDSMEAFSVRSLIKVNNRRFLDGLAEAAGIDEESEKMGLIAAIDRMEKVGLDETIDYVNQHFGDEAAELTRDYLSVKGGTLERVEGVAEVLGSNQAATEGADNLQRVFSMLEASGYDSDKVVFDQAIARGLDYYTGIIYETTVVDTPELGSVCSGGRFDNLISDMGGPDLPAVGTSIGVDRLYDALQKLGKLKAVQTATKIMIANFGADESADYMRLATTLRQAGIPTEIQYDAKKIGRQIAAASKIGIPYFIFMGSEEIKNGTVQLKDLETGEQEEVETEELIETLRGTLHQSR